MNNLSIMAMAGVLALVAGCTTSSQVQEMIDGSRRDSLDQSASHEASIDVLKQSSMAALEKGKANGADIAKLEQLIKEIQITLASIKNNAEAAKLMSASNTVKVADLETTVSANKANFQEARAAMKSIDELYEQVLIQHYTALADSAAAAILALKADNNTSATAPVVMGGGIVITAPDTSLVTGNAVSTNTPAQ